MTPRDQDVFCKAAALGVACGLEHHYEWYVNASRSFFSGPYTEISRLKDELLAAFVAFEKTTASCPEEEEELVTMTDDDFVDRISQWYMRPR